MGGRLIADWHVVTFSFRGLKLAGLMVCSMELFDLCIFCCCG